MAAFGELDDEDFTQPVYAAVRRAIASAGGPARDAEESWTSEVRDRAEDESARSTIAALAVEPLRFSGEPTQQLAAALHARVQELTALRRIAQVKSRLQRMNPVEEVVEYNRMFGELVALEQHRRTLREQAIGGGLS